MSQLVIICELRVLIGFDCSHMLQVDLIAAERHVRQLLGLECLLH
jgi:hypothetical protein